MPALITILKNLKVVCGVNVPLNLLELTSPYWGQDVTKWSQDNDELVDARFL